MILTWSESARSLFPGLLASVTIAIAALFLNEHYGAPAMLFALLLGLSFKFLSDEGPCVPGILTSSTTILRIGVALLGFRITTDQVIALGPGEFHAEGCRAADNCSSHMCIQKAQLVYLLTVGS